MSEIVERMNINYIFILATVAFVVFTLF